MPRTVTEKQLKNSKAGGALVGKRNGQTIIYKDGSMGGYAVGNLHSQGGIKGQVKGGGQKVEFQGSEVVITAPAVADNTKHEFNGQMLTNRQILSRINEGAGGVSFEKGGDIPKTITCTGKKYTYGGKLATDSDIVSGCGCKHEQAKMEKGGEIENKELRDPAKFKKALKKAKPHVYELLVGEFDCGPYDGGCVIMAEAIQMVIGGNVVVLTTIKGRADHAAVQIGNKLYDASGSLPEKQFIKKFNEENQADSVYIREIRSTDFENAPRNKEASNKIFGYLTGKSMEEGGEIKPGNPLYKTSSLSQKILADLKDDKSEIKIEKPVKLMQVIKGIRYQIREYKSANDLRYFTATIHRWNGFKFLSKDIKSTPLLNDYVIPKVKEIRDMLDGKTASEQGKIVDNYPTTFNF